MVLELCFVHELKNHILIRLFRYLGLRLSSYLGLKPEKRLKFGVMSGLALRYPEDDRRKDEPDTSDFLQNLSYLPISISQRCRDVIGIFSNAHGHVLNLIYSALFTFLKWHSPEGVLFLHATVFQCLQMHFCAHLFSTQGLCG